MSNSNACNRNEYIDIKLEHYIMYSYVLILYIYIYICSIRKQKEYLTGQWSIDRGR